MLSKAVGLASKTMPSMLPSSLGLGSSGELVSLNTVSKSLQWSRVRGCKLRCAVYTLPY